ncbi:MAG: tetrahydromethanopterin S-methyltransferase subunit G [Canidatus Methanoxibalbensis ujae]|nr:tetrahydromethanopterin S-methyltransferase subunit G [Candidatus Methanoxibalbensis ujae]MCW7078846.1 tetrahydromethanopterin S-methyltransferase subunit G [Candidatus Methanoxibalbensis ujae]
MAEDKGKEEAVEKGEEVAIPIAMTPPEYRKLIDRLKAMDEKVEFVMGELSQRQGEKIGFTIGILYGLIVGTLLYVLFLL